MFLVLIVAPVLMLAVSKPVLLVRLIKLDVVTAASNTSVSRSGSEGRLGVRIDANETNTESSLVCVDGVVLVVADTAVPDTTIVLVGELAEGDDTTIFTRRGRGVQGRELVASLGNVGNLVRNSIALKT